ncbi:MAG: hypothetical protein KatS3mg082_2508 [Nitrospiraceae bacterium]|nr:MAG: hypothetical protein KatS3mg082_2508 [Nitrospiraceae bacterium]
MTIRPGNPISDLGHPIQPPERLLSARRAPLIAFNVNLNTGNLETAKAIAKKVRFSAADCRT